MRIFIIISFFVVSMISGELQKVALQLKWKHQFQFAGFIVAKEKGFYKAEGLDVTLKEFDSSINIVKDVRQGKAEFGIGDSALVLESMRGVPVVAMMAVFQQSPFVLMALQSSDIKDIKDIDGKEIALFESAHGATIGAMLKSNGIAYQRRSVKNKFDQLIHKKIDAISAYNTNEVYIAKEMGLDIVTFNPKEYGFEAYGDILFTSKALLQDSPELVNKMHKASMRGWEYAYRHIDEVVEIIHQKYNHTLHKSKEALLYEANALKEISGYGKNLGKFEKLKIENIAQMFSFVIAGKYHMDNLNSFIYTPRVDISLKKSNHNSLTQQEKAYVKNKKILKVCTNPNWQPIEFNQDGTPEGISIDTLKIISRTMKIDLEFVKTSSWSQSQQFLKDKKCDILPAAIETTKRLAYANFTKPYLRYDLAIVTRDDKPLVTSLDTIIDKSMSRKKGSGLISKLKAQYPKIDIMETKGYKEAFQGVSDGDTYFTIATLPVLAYYKNKLRLKNLQIAGYTKMKYNLSVAVNKDDKVLLGIINKALDQIDPNTHNIIFEKWTTNQVEFQTDYDLIWQLLSLFIAILALILYFANRQRELQKELKASLATISRNVIMSETDLDGIIINASDAFCKISGYSKDELIGKSHNVIRHPDMKNEPFKDLWETIQKDKIWDGRIKNLKKDGAFYWVSAVITPVFKNGVKTGYTSIREDITDKNIIEELNSSLEQKIKTEVEKSRQKDQQIIQQSRLAQMGEMISMIAHQWRQPLAAISSTCSVINVKAKLHKLDNEEAIGLSNRISEYSQHLSATIDDFREFFTSDKKKKKTTYNELISSALSIVESSIVNQNIQIIQNLKCKEMLYTYSNEVKQVILSLIKNSEDVLLEKGIKNPKITIETHDGVLSIGDNGGGIPEKIIEKIFDPYFSTKEAKDGTGLGLYMSKTIIEEHCKGTLSVRNGNEGAIFRVTLKESDDE